MLLCLCCLRCALLWCVVCSVICVCFVLCCVSLRCVALRFVSFRFVSFRVVLWLCCVACGSCCVVVFWFGLVLLFCVALIGLR